SPSDGLEKPAGESMILLDTDHVTALRYAEHPRGLTLNARLQSSGDPVVATTAITPEEQMRGWPGELGRRQEAHKQVPAYAMLADLFQFFSKWQVVPFDDRAADRFEALRKQRIRIGTPDLKIAAITLVHDAVLLSANLRDFEKVPELRVENWLV